MTFLHFLLHFNLKHNIHYFTNLFQKYLHIFQKKLDFSFLCCFFFKNLGFFAALLFYSLIYHYVRFVMCLNSFVCLIFNENYKTSLTLCIFLHWIYIRIIKWHLKIFKNLTLNKNIFNYEYLACWLILNSCFKLFLFFFLINPCVQKKSRNNTRLSHQKYTRLSSCII